MTEKMRDTKILLDSHSLQDKIFGFSNSLSKDLSQLNKKVVLPNSQLIQCTTNQEKFYAILQNLNSQGISSILNQQYEQSLIYFAEAERILQYVASCGKVIDRNLIIVILHNIGCSYEKLYDLSKLSSYLEALIYNLSLSLTHSEANALNFLKNKKVFDKNSAEYDCLCSFLKKKMDFGKYHLQFSTLNSKLFEHDTAIAYAKNAIQIFKQICDVCDKYEAAVHNEKINQTISHIPKLSSVEIQLNPSYYQSYIKKVKKLIERGHPKKEQNKQIYNVFSKFSIGKMIQMSPIKIEDYSFKIDLDFQCSKIEKARRALYIGVGYFTIGTQYRLLSSASQSKNQNCKSSGEFLLSEIYHIYCILIVLIYVPCQTLFLTNLLTSYNNHYEGELEKQIKKKSQGQCQQNEAIPIQMLPEHSSIQEGQSKWSRSQLKSYSEQNNELHTKKSGRERNKILMIKKKQKVGIQYKVNFNHIKSVISLGKISSAERSTDSLKDGFKYKTQNSIKKSSLSKSKRQDTKSSDKKKKHTKQKKKKSQQKEKNRFQGSKYQKKGKSKVFSSYKQQYLLPKNNKMNKSKSKSKSKETQIKTNAHKEIKSIQKQKKQSCKVNLKILQKKNISGKKEKIQKTQKTLKQKKSQDKKKTKKNGLKQCQI